MPEDTGQILDTASGSEIVLDYTALLAQAESHAEASRAEAAEAKAAQARAEAELGYAIRFIEHYDSMMFHKAFVKRRFAEVVKRLESRVERSDAENARLRRMLKRAIEQDCAE